MILADRIKKLRSALGKEPTVWFRAPGRVNLMGDHTDYNEGFVLPAAIQLDCLIASTRGSDGMIKLRSIEFDGEVHVPADGSVDASSVSPDWGKYVAGVVSVLAKRGRAPIGIDASISSTVPAGSGLSSSAALEVAVALALLDAARLEIPKLDIALACREAEQVATGVPCGIMDQYISLLGKRSHVLLIDCRSLSSRGIQIPPDVGIIALHSGLQRSLSESEYAQRRNSCLRISQDLGIPALRDAEAEQVADKPLARHVVSENARVHLTAQALEEGLLDQVGGLFLESHQSLKEDFGVSTPELDELVDALVGAGAAGARLTGAGFGGAVVAVAPKSEVLQIAENAAVAYSKSTGLEPAIFPVNPADGAARLST